MCFRAVLWATSLLEVVYEAVGHGAGMVGERKIRVKSKLSRSNDLLSDDRDVAGSFPYCKELSVQRYRTCMCIRPTEKYFLQ